MTTDYERNHRAVKRVRGRAGDLLCKEGKDHAAHDWSQVHDTDGSDPHIHFRPLCRRHHLIYDEPIAKRTRNLSRKGAKHTMETKAKISKIAKARSINRDEKGKFA